MGITWDIWRYVQESWWKLTKLDIKADREPGKWLGSGATCTKYRKKMACTLYPTNCTRASYIIHFSPTAVHVNHSLPRGHDSVQISCPRPGRNKCCVTAKAPPNVVFSQIYLYSWEAVGNGNGCPSLLGLVQRILDDFLTFRVQSGGCLQNSGMFT
jgi:hypothetical protein